MEEVLRIFLGLPLWLQIIITIIVLGFTLFNSLRFVNEAEQGLRLRFGRVVRDKEGEPIIIEPGFVFIIPMAESLQKHHTREQPLTLNEQQIILKDRSVFFVGAAILFSIENIYKALFEIDNVELAVKNCCMGALRDILQKLEDADEITDTAKLSQEIYAYVQPQAEKWGVQITSFRIMNCAPSNETATFLNAKAAVRARFQALQEVGVNNPQLAAALLGIQTTNTIGTKMSDEGI
jgi:regulator of protease activity HflC (stomatin/prohibitin superfamily)